jgi:hypothetical protein
VECVWKTLPASRILYGPDLIAAGWDTSSPRPPNSTLEHEIEFTEKNVAVFDTVLDRMSRLITPRCCGC